MSGYLIERIQDIFVLEGLRERWDALLKTTSTKTVELSYEWQITYWKYFNKDAELFILTVKDANTGEVIAIVPLKLVYKKISGTTVRRLELIAAAESNYQDFIIGNNEPTVIECVMNYLLEIQTAWDLLVLSHIPETSTTASYLLNNLASFPVRRIMADEMCMMANLTETIGSQKAKRKQHRKAQLRKAEQGLGELELQKSSSEEQLRSGLIIFFDLHRKKWNKTETPSIFNDDNYCKFYLEVAQQLFRKNQIELVTLVAGKREAAQALNFKFGKIVIGQLIIYDIDLIKYSPETLLMQLYINQLMNSDIKILDLGSYYPYKKRWANQFKRRMDFQLYPKKPISTWLFLFSKVNYFLLTNLRKYPLLLNFIKRLRSIGRLRAKINFKESH